MADLDDLRKSAREGKLDAPPAPEPEPMAPAYKPGDHPLPGTLVKLTGRFHGHAIVSARRFVQRGRHANKWEYSLAPLTEGQFGAKTFGARVIGEPHFVAPTIQVTAATARERIEGRYAAFVQKSSGGSQLFLDKTVSCDGHLPEARPPG